MEDKDFVHLHVHSDGSRLDGLGTPGRLITAAKRLGFNKLALTDHGSLTNAIIFTKFCNDLGIKPILGMEGYIEVSGNVGHITLLADGQDGFNSLIQLNNLGQKSKFSRPAFNVDNLIAHSKGIICLSGCPASPLQSMEYPDAKELGLKLKGVFGNRLFAEMMFVNENPYWERSFRLSQNLRIPMVLTNDVHFANKEDAPIHTLLTKMKAGFTYESKNLYLAKPDEIRARILKMGYPDAMPLAERAMENAGRIGDIITPIKFSEEPHLPHIENAEQKLIDLVYQSLDAKGMSGSEVMNRAELELKIIGRMQFSTYFLILHDLVSFAKRSGIRVGPGRGSGAGSLVLYAIGITEINPLEYGLSFERFLNPSRHGMPDVDVDFDSDGRHTVIQYAVEKWGAFPVATYSRYSHKMLVHDLAKFFHVPRKIEEDAADGGEDSAEFKTIVSKEPQFRQAYDILLGQIRHLGQHAGGIIISDIEAPLERVSGDEGLAVSWTEGDNKELSSTGFVKYDLLGLSALGALKILEDKYGRRAEDPRDDDPVFSLFRSGDLAGIFQFTGSSGIVQYTKTIAPRCFNDLVLINALYRPGALDAGTAKYYPEWRKSPRKIHPIVDGILAETSGVIVYQEQVMAVYSALTNGDAVSADNARRTISKSKIGEAAWELDMAKLREVLENGCEAKGVSKEIANQIWDEIATHSRYSFNKSHSVAYARVAWDLAWWKYHYPADFYAAMLTIDSAEAQKYIFDIVSHGVEIMPPHVNVSSKNYEAKDGKVWMPLSAVKYAGEKGVKSILDNRPYKSMADFVSKTSKKGVNSRVRKGLYALGAFAGLDGKLSDLLLDTDPTLPSKLENQEQYMGFIIPETDLIKKIAAANSSGFVAGIVYERVEKESDYGKYVVYRMLPTGSPWSRDIVNIKVGDAVQFKVQANNNKILKAFSL